MNGGVNGWMNEDFMKTAVLSQQDYAGFRTALEGMPHALPHIFIGGGGGEMLTMGSPNDPVFFLHHANVDRYWYKWQQQNPAFITEDSYGGPNHVGNPSKSSDLLMFLTNGAQWQCNGPKCMPADFSKFQLSGSKWKTTIGDVIDSKGSQICVNYQDTTVAPTKAKRAAIVPLKLTCIQIDYDSQAVETFLTGMRMYTDVEKLEWKLKIAEQTQVANALINAANIKNGYTADC